MILYVLWNPKIVPRSYWVFATCFVLERWHFHIWGCREKCPAVFTWWLVCREDSMEILVTDGLSATTVDVRVEVSRPRAGAPDWLLVPRWASRLPVEHSCDHSVTPGLCGKFFHLSFVRCTLWSGWLESDAVAEHVGHQVYGHKGTFVSFPIILLFASSDALYSSCSHCFPSRQVNEQNIDENALRMCKDGWLALGNSNIVKKPKFPYFKLPP